MEISLRAKTSRRPGFGPNVAIQLHIGSNFNVQTSISFYLTMYYCPTPGHIPGGMCTKLLYRATPKLTMPKLDPSSVPLPCWPITPRLRWSRPCEGLLTKVEANEGSSPPTTALPGTPPAGPPSESSPKSESGSSEMGGISNSSSPRLGVWNVCR